MSSPGRILKQVFGHDRFRGPQEAIIDHVLAGGDAVVLMPTGGGKSLCYQVPALVRPGTAVVISPLIALMRDQVRALEGLGVRAAGLHSGLAPEAGREVVRRLRAGDLDILYTAPERFMTPGFQELLSAVPLALFAIDEAHCVSQWGHDFRPEYLQLAVIAERFPGVPRLALTATADGPTREDIRVRLALEGARVFATGFDRPNIRYTVAPKDHARRQLLAWIRAEHPGQSGIVYRLSRNKVEDLADWLSAHGVPALAYHAGLGALERDRRQDRFMAEEGLVMVATVAFGMGVDKPDVRFVAHLDPPKSLEAYHQETGRAGRDGAPAEAFMLYAPGDFVALRRLIAPEDADVGRKRIELAKLDALVGYCECDTCRRQTLLGYFGETLAEPCGNCDICAHPAPSVDVTVAAQKALSCVFRTGQRFGAGHCIDVLLGRNTQRVTRLGHDGLSTFRIGGEFVRTQWEAVFRRLAAMGALASHPEGHGGLVLTPASWDILKGRRGLTMRLPGAEAAREKRSRGARPSPRKSWIEEELTESGDVALWTVLRTWRTDKAREAGVAPYVIFHDRTLLDIVRLKPRDRDGLAAANGMGQAKLDRYGRALWDILAHHYLEFGRCRPRPPEPEEPTPPAVSRGRGDTAAESLRLFRALGSVAAVAKERDLTAATVCGHLLPFVARGELDARTVTGQPENLCIRAEAVIETLRRHGVTGLVPVYDALDGLCDYNVLRLLEAGLRASGKLGPDAAP